jgi:hypothetical protein
MDISGPNGVNGIGLGSSRSDRHYKSMNSETICAFIAGVMGLLVLGRAIKSK